jgi:flagella basal body P-ring formation protein FlgA
MSCKLFTLFAIALAGGLFSATCAEGGESAVAVTLRLRPNSEVTSELITLGDIAEVVCSDPQLRRSLEQLDLAELKGDEPLAVERKQIELRLQLAGHDVQYLTFTGSKGTTVRKHSLNNNVLPDLVKTVRDQIAVRFRLSPEDLDVTLLTPWQEPLTTGQQLRYEALLPDAVPLGRRNVWIRTLDGDRLLNTRQVVVEVRRRQQVLVATRDLPIGTKVTVDDVATEEQWSTTPYSLMTLDEVLARTVSRPLRQGDVLTPPMLSVVHTVKQQIVKPREAVTVVARRGQLNVTMQAAEAVEGGAVGDRVLVRNPESKRLMTGVIIGPGQVAIDLGGIPAMNTPSAVQTATRPNTTPVPR